MKKIYYRICFIFAMFLLGGWVIASKSNHSLYVDSVPDTLGKSQQNVSSPLVPSLVWNYLMQPNYTRMEYGASPAIRNLGPGVNAVGGEPDNFLEIVTGSDEYSNFFPELNSQAFGIWRCFDALGNLEWAVDTKSDESRTSVAITDIDNDLDPEIATGTTSGWCVEVMNKFGSWTPGVSDAAWTFPYEPQRSGSFMWHSSPAVGELIAGPNHEGLEVVAGNNPLSSIWAFDGDNSDGINDGDTANITSWGYPGPTGIEGVDWDVLWVFQANGSIIASPAIGDIDGDGFNEVVCGSKDQNLYCLNGATGALKWSFPTSGMITGSAGLADFDNNGTLEIIVGSQDHLVYFIKGDLNSDGIINPSEFTSFTTGGAVYSSPAIADVNNDGQLDVIIGSDDWKLYCLNYSPGTNSVTTTWEYMTGNAVRSSPAIANSGRTNLTIYAGSSDSVLYIIDGSGSLINSYHSNGQIITSPAIADIDGDGKLEIAVTAWRIPDEFIVLRDNGSNVAAFASPWPMFRHDTRHTGLYNWAPPALADDVGVIEITQPEGSLLQGAVITPHAVVHNFGDSTALNFTVTFEIRNDAGALIYASTQTVTTLASHASLDVSFGTLTATAGYFHTKAYTVLPGDEEPDDDQEVGLYLVVQSQWVLNLEQDDGDLNPMQVPGGWEWGIPTSGPMSAHSGSNVWATILAGDYNNSVNWKLDSPLFYAQQNNPVLSFWHWYNIENNRDGGNVKISFNGIDWTLLNPVGGYPGIAIWNNPGIPDQPCFNSLSGGWQLTSFILPVTEGQFFLIRWQFGSDNVTTRPGWYIDDLMGDGFDKALMVTAEATTIPCQGGTSTVTVTATGGTPPYAGTGTFVVTAGTHTFNVTDVNLVPGRAIITVAEPSALTAYASFAPTPCIGGTSLVTVSAFGGTLPYSYLWSDGSTSQSIGSAAPGSYSVTVTDANGCLATSGIEVTQQPPTSITISPSANPVDAGTEVMFTAIPVNAGGWQFYDWKVNGINTGYGIQYFNYTPVNNDSVICIMTTSDGCIDTSNTIIMTVNYVSPVTVVQNDTVYDGQSACFDAMQSIIVAGNGTTFLVQTGGVVNMIAGQNIQYLPGTRVEWGGMMHGYISTTGEECPSQPASLVSTVVAEDAGSPDGELSFMKIYPNPTNGIFTLELNGAESDIPARIEIYGMRSEKILTEMIPGVSKHEFSLEHQPAGIYIIKVVSGMKLGLSKIVKTR